MTDLYTRFDARFHKYLVICFGIYTLYTACTSLADFAKQRNGAVSWETAFTDNTGCPVPFFNSINSFASSTKSLVLYNFLNEAPMVRVCTNSSSEDLLQALKGESSVVLYDPVEYAGSLLNAITQLVYERSSCNMANLGKAAAQCTSSSSEDVLNCSSALLNTPPSPTSVSAGFAWLYNLEVEGTKPSFTFTVSRNKVSTIPCPARYVWSVRQDSLLGAVATAIVALTGFRILFEMIPCCCDGPKGFSCCGHPRLLRQIADEGALGPVYACRGLPPAPKTTWSVFVVANLYDFAALVLAASPYFRDGLSVKCSFNSSRAKYQMCVTASLLSAQ